MKLVINRVKLSAFAVLIIGALVISTNVSWVNATISTNYEVASVRLSGSTNPDSAVLESPKSMSGDGRYIVFTSSASDLVSSDTNGYRDVFVRDTVNDTTTLVSVSSAGVQANNYSWHGSISYDGRFVVFESGADNLVSGVTGSNAHIYLRDLINNTTTLVDSSATGTVGNARAMYPKVSADGRFVVFMSFATNLVPGISQPNVSQVYIKDLNTNSIKALSVTSSGAPGDRDSTMADISCDGNIVVFTTSAYNLGVPSSTTSRYDLVIVSLGWNNDILTNVTTSYASGIYPSPLGSPQISCDGNKVLFRSSGEVFVTPTPPSGYPHIYQYNRLDDSFIQVSLGNGDVQPGSAQNGQHVNASMSGDGRYVAFTSFSSQLDLTYPKGSDTGSSGSVYIRDVKNSTTEAVTILPSGNLAAWTGGQQWFQ